MIRHALRNPAILLVIIASISALCFPLQVRAEPPYNTLSRDGYGRLINTQADYYPAKVIANDIYVTGMKDGRQFREYSPLSNPQDLFIDKKDDIYIADTGNNRIVRLNPDGQFVRAYDVPESKLNKPQGVFVDGDGAIYIADTGNKRVVKLDESGRMQSEFKRPDSGYMNETVQYEPTRVVVDDRGFLFVTSNGSYQGVIQLDPDGNFYGFYGTNQTEVSLMDIVRKTFYTQEQLSRVIRTLPETITNLFIDGEGYIYTVSGGSSEQVKKLNIRGENMWKDKSFGFRIRNRPAATGGSGGSGTDQTDESENKRRLTDVTVDKNGNMTIVDKSSNAVMRYAANGKLLFFWTGPVVFGTPQLGISQSPASVASDSKNRLFVLDDSQNLIHVLEPTEFGLALEKAYEQLQEGKYAESEASWKEVLKLNALYSPAYQGLAEAAFHREDYRAALHYYKMAGDAAGYSDSFWQLRLQWFQSNFSYMANGFFAVAFVAIGAGRIRSRLPSLRKRKQDPGKGGPELIGQLRHAFTILKHPLEGFADLRYARKGSVLSALVILGMAVCVLLVKQFYTSFTFMPVPASDRSTAFLTVFGVTWLTWLVCNYLIGSITQGEARFKDVFIGSSYALFPIVLLGLPLAVVSNGMTMSESSIYHFVESAMFAWCGLLFFWQIQAMQNFGVGETIVNILLTFVAMIVLWVLISITFGLSTEVQDFAYTIYQEVSM